MQDDQDKTQGPDREASNSPLLPDPLPTFSFSFSTFSIAAADLHRRIPCIPRQMSMSLGQSGASGHHNLPGSVSMDMGVTKDVEALRGYVDNRFTQTNAKIAALDVKVDQGFARVDEGFARVDERFAQVDGAIKELRTQTNERFAYVGIRFDRLDNRIDNMDNDMQAMRNHMQIMDNRIQIMDNNMHIMHNDIQTMHHRMQTMDNKIQTLDDNMQAMDNRISQLQASVDTIIELLRSSGTVPSADIPTFDTTHAQASSSMAQGEGEGEAVISHHTAQIHHSADILSSMARGIVRAKSALSLKLKPSKSRTDGVVHDTGFVALGCTINSVLLFPTMLSTLL
ncbi:hypothetical protein A0H81_07787 [Grifola frondosa]|uniref:t-SNARE coiled-coil homology domain-containing protein n=1 Tax=Grifola frondosa TaxID=5627 RepID=A0A1C7M879_GRIFR|nr:hypothetical protein A0H81_07787 [Grifola frondosa]